MRTNIKLFEIQSTSKNHTLKFKTLTDWDSEKIMISKKLNNGDWDYYLAIKIMYLDSYMTESEVRNVGKYSVELLAVSPAAAGSDNVNKALDGYDGIKITELVKCEALIQYGISACLFDATGNDLNELKAEAFKQADIIPSMFGFYMDRPLNAIGNDGWDFISGNIGWHKIE
jgi:hypothetical protein